MINHLPFFAFSRRWQPTRSISIPIFSLALVLSSRAGKKMNSSFKFGYAHYFARFLLIYAFFHPISGISFTIAQSYSLCTIDSDAPIPIRRTYATVCRQFPLFWLQGLPGSLFAQPLPGKQSQKGRFARRPPFPCARQLRAQSLYPMR